MECLGQMLWESQRSGRPPDGEAYVAGVQRLATTDGSFLTLRSLLRQDGSSSARPALH
jgi:hypothetical protein